MSVRNQVVPLFNYDAHDRIERKCETMRVSGRYGNAPQLGKEMRQSTECRVLYEMNCRCNAMHQRNRNRNRNGQAE